MSPPGSARQSSPAPQSSCSAGEFAAEQLRTSSRECDCRDRSPLLATGPNNGVRSAAATPPVHPSPASGAPSRYPAAARSRLVVGSRHRHGTKGVTIVTAGRPRWASHGSLAPATSRRRQGRVASRCWRHGQRGPGTRPGRCIGGGQDAGPRRPAHRMGGRADHRAQRSAGGLLADTAQLGTHRAARRRTRETRAGHSSAS